MKNKKKLLILIIAAAAAVILAVLLIFKPFENKTVRVFPVSSLATMDYSQEEQDLSGTIRSEGFQSVYLSDTQKVSEILVQPGQQVEAGQPLLSYDTTLSDLELEKAALAVQKKELELQKAQKELEQINQLEPSSEVLIEPDNSWIRYEPVTTPYLQGGSGSEADPFYYLISSSDRFTESFFRQLLPEGKTEVFVVLLLREKNAVNGKILNSYGFHISFADDEFSFVPFEHEIPENIAHYDEPEEPYYEQRGSEFSAGEIAAMRIALQARISELYREIKLAELDYQKKKLEVSDTVVKAKTAGIVKTVNDPETAAKNGEPVIRISAGGGFYVDILLSELALGTVNPGDPVTVSSYESGTVCSGQITKVSDMPAEDASSGFSSGNSLVSYYPATVFIPEDAALKDGEYVTVSASETALEGDTFYLENMFLIREKGHTYVYADNNGKLEKREVHTGNNLYGYATQITEGLSTEDLIAFPYEKAVKEGAPTTPADVSELYE